VTLDESVDAMLRSDDTSRGATRPFAEMNAVDWLVLTAAALLLTATLPSAFAPNSTPRLAVVLLVLPVGIACSIRQAMRGDRAALAGLAFVAWTAVSSGFSSAPILGMLGAFGRETSSLIFAGSLAIWSLARSMSTLGRRLLPIVMLAAMALGVAVGAMQVLVRSSSGVLSLVMGRAHGLTGGPVYYGAVMAAGVALAAGCARHRNGSLWPYALLTAGFAAACNWSGSRFPVVLGLLAAFVILAAARRFSDAVWMVLSFAGGFGLASLVSRSVAEGGSVLERADAESAGRTSAWRYGLEAILDRPLVGWGPGNFRPAVQERFSAEFTGQHARDELTQIWFDAHNFPLGIAVSFGMVGFGLMVWWVVIAARSSRGPLALFASALALSWLLEPAFLATFPIAMLSVGAAWREPATADPRSQPRSLTIALGVAGALLAVSLFATDLRFARAIKANRPDAAATVAEGLFWDPVAANAVASALYNSSNDDEVEREALDWIDRSIDRQPDWPFYYNAAAQILLTLGEPDAAGEYLDDALRLQPWNVQSLLLQREVALATANTEMLENVDDRLCRVHEALCPST
jgi:O-antigen ligase